MMVVTSAETLGLCAGRRSRSSSCRSTPPAARCAARSRRAQDPLADATAFAAESLRRVRVMQAFVAEAFAARALPRRRRGGLSTRRAAMTQCARVRHRRRDVPRLRQRRRRAVARRAATCVAGRMTGGRAVAIPALRRARRRRARPTFGSVERGFAGRRRGRRASANSWRSSRASSRRAAPRPCPRRRAARSRSSASASPIRRGRTSRCCEA